MRADVRDVPREEGFEEDDFVAGVAQRLNGDVDGLRGGGGDEDLSGLALARGSVIPLDRGAEFGSAGDDGVLIRARVGGIDDGVRGGAARHLGSAEIGPALAEVEHAGRLRERGHLRPHLGRAPPRDGCTRFGRQKTRGVRGVGGVGGHRA